MSTEIVVLLKYCYLDEIDNNVEESQRASVSYLMQYARLPRSDVQAINNQQSDYQYFHQIP